MTTQEKEEAKVIGKWFAICLGVGLFFLGLNVIEKQIGEEPHLV